MYLTEEDFEKHLFNIQRSQFLPTDTEGELNHPFANTWGVSTSANSVPEYFAFNHFVGDNLPDSWLPRLKETITNHPCLIFHNAKHDLRALKALGIDYQGKFYDTMLMAHMIDENIFSKELDYLSKMYGGEPKRKSEEMALLIKAFGWKFVPVDYIRPYSANDAYITGELFHKLYPDFQEQGFDGELWDIEQKFIRLMAKIEDNGIPIDIALSEQEFERGIGIMKEIQGYLGFNPASPIELGNFLLDEMKLPPYPKKTKGGKNTFNKQAMMYYDELLQLTNDKRAELILTYRGWQKTTSSNYKRYLEDVHPDGRLRPNYKLHGTLTGRLSCEKPNLQQIPRESSNDWNGHLKRAFITEEGFTAYEADFSQLELRLGTAYGKVSRLKEIFAEDRDIFDEMSKDLGMSRFNTKTLNYTLQFGGGANRIKDVFGVSELAAKAIIRNYFNQYPGLAKASNQAKFLAEQRGYVRYWTNRRRHFSNQYDESRKAFNAICQGGAFEIVKRRMIALDEAGLNNSECRMDLQVHDSVRFEIENGKEGIYLPEIERIMENVNEDFNFGVRFRVKIKRWGE